MCKSVESIATVMTSLTRVRYQGSRHQQDVWGFGTWDRSADESCESGICECGSNTIPVDTGSGPVTTVTNTRGCTVWTTIFPKGTSTEGGTPFSS